MDAHRLTETMVITRKADREALAYHLGELAAVHGAAVERRDRGREIYLTLRRGGLAVSVSIDGASKVGALFGHWTSETLLPPGFGPAIGGHVNQYHGRKATTVATRFASFCASIEAGFRCVATEGKTP